MTAERRLVWTGWLNGSLVGQDGIVASWHTGMAREVGVYR